MIKNWIKIAIGMAAAALMASGAAAQTLGVGGQLAANPAPSAVPATLPASAAPVSFVISTTIGLGKLNISALTGGLVQDAGGPSVGATGGTAEAGTETSGEATDTEAAAETEVATLIESSIQAIQQTVTRDTTITETTVVAVEPTSDTGKSNNGVGEGVGGGRENNRGVGNGEGGGKENNRGGKK